MRKHIWAISCVLASFFTSSCTTVGVINNQNDTLGQDEVILLTRITAPNSSIVLSAGGMDDVYNAPVSEALRSVTLKDGENLLALRVKKGETYKIGRYHVYPLVASFSKDPFLFKPATEGMTYIGDIKLTVDYSENPPQARMQIFDNESRTVMLFKQRYPILFEKYRYQKVMASRVQ